MATTFTIEPAMLVGFSLALVRSAAWVAVCPPFNSPTIPVRIRAGVAVALSFAMAGRFANTVTGAELNQTGPFVLLLLAQAIAGFAIGALVLLLFTAVQAAGDFMDYQVGFALGAVLDPVSGNQSSPLGRLHQFLALVIMFVSNGHLLVIRGLVRSVDVSPEGVPNLGALADAAGTAISTMFLAAAEIALPILAALFCAEIALGLLGKAAPQMNILTLGFASRTFLAILLLGMTLFLLPESVDSLLMQAIRSGLGIFTG